eukprot:2273522-Ditylum_brightwellii.AAC.1
MLPSSMSIWQKPESMLPSKKWIWGATPGSLLPCSSHTFDAVLDIHPRDQLIQSKSKYSKGKDCCIPTISAKDKTLCVSDG